jgi:hypothetical protein
MAMSLALRDNGFEAKLAGVGEDGRAVALDMLIEPDAGAGLGHDRCECSLADLKRIAPKVVAVQLDEVEGVEEYALVSPVMADEVERSIGIGSAESSWVSLSAESSSGDKLT